MQKKISKSYIIYTTILIIILLFTVFVIWKQNEKGTLEIKKQGNALKFFIDKEEKSPRSFKEDMAIFSLKEGIHSVIINKQGFWPWAKAFNLKQKENIQLNPFFVAKDTNGFIIKKEDTQYSEISSLFDNNLINPFVKEKLMFDPSSILKIKSADFYKDRNDVVIIAAENAVYALEIDNPENRNLQPIYKGNSPIFVKKDNETLYIKDNDQLMMVNY